MVMQLAGNFKPSCAEMLDHLLFAKAQQLKTSIQLTQSCELRIFGWFYVKKTWRVGLAAYRVFG